MSNARHAPWALLPCVVLALSSVTLLAPHHAAQADAPKATLTAVSASHPAAKAAYDDGDGDELLEHWGDPKYSREERVQIAGIAFLLIPVWLFSRRGRTKLRRARGL